MTTAPLSSTEIDVQDVPLTRTEIGVGVAIILAWLAVNLLSLSSYPPPHCDESWYVASAYHFLNTGQAALPFYQNLYNMGQSLVHFGRLYIVPLSSLVALFDAQLPILRLSSLLGVAVAALTTGLAARRLYHCRAGLVAALIVLVAWYTFGLGHFVRPEIWLAAFSAWLVLLYWNYSEKPAILNGLFFGFIVVIPTNLHPNGLFYVLGFGILCLLEIGIRQRKITSLLAAGAGAIISGLLYAALHFLPDIQVSLTQMTDTGQTLASTTIPILIREQARWVYLYFWKAYMPLSIIQMLYVLPAIALAIWRRGRANEALLVVTVISFIAHLVLKTVKLWPATVLWTPFIAILLAGNLDTLIDLLKLHTLPLLKRLPRHSLLILVATPLLLTFLAGDAWLAYRFKDSDFESTAATIQADVPPGSRIISNELWWFPLYDEDREFLSDYYFFLGRYQPDFDFAVEFKEYAPDYVLIDDSGFGCSEAAIPEYFTYREIVTATCAEVSHYATVGFSHARTYTLFACD